MENTIQTLAEFVQTVCSEASHPREEAREVQRFTFLEEEEARIREKIQQTVFAIGKDRKSAQFLLLQQNELTELANRIYLRLRELPAPCLEDPDIPCQPILREALQTVRRLLRFLQKSYPGLFHGGLKAPLANRDWVEEDLGFKRETILLALGDRGVDASLNALLTEYLSCLRSQTGFCPATWRDFRYLRNFTAAFAQLSLEPERGPEAFSQHLMRLLFFLNFNAAPFYSYCLGKINSITESCLSIREQRRELLYLLKLWRQPPERPEVAFDPSSPSIKESAVKYLEEELSYLERLEHLHAEPHVKGGSREPYPFYFQVSFTSSQLVFFVRLLVEAGIILTKRKADLHAFLANHVGTARKDNLSEHSLKNKSYAPSSATARKVKAQLHLLLQLLNEKYL